MARTWFQFAEPTSFVISVVAEFRHRKNALFINPTVKNSQLSALPIPGPAVSMAFQTIPCFSQLPAERGKA